MITDMPEHLIYSITTNNCQSTHPGNDNPLSSFEVVRNGLPEIVNTWRGSHFIRCANLLENLTETHDQITPAEPLLVITKPEHVRLVSMLESTDEDGTTTARTLPLQFTEIVALIERWRNEQTTTETAHENA